MALGAGQGSAATPRFVPAGSAGTVQPTALSEASGLVVSRRNPGVIWTHNDSGSAGRVFAISTSGALLATYPVPAAGSDDFEDIAIGLGPLPDFHYVYLGDIGDNLRQRSSIRVFRFIEPAVYQYQSNAPTVAPAHELHTIFLSYPDGKYDAETLMMDPFTGDLFIVTKEDAGARLYRAPKASLDASSAIQLTFVRPVSIAKASGGDISPDGRLVSIRRGGSAAIWVRGVGRSIGDMLSAPPVGIPVIGPPTEPNGEAIGFSADARGYYTLSEGPHPPLYFFRRTDAGAPMRPLALIGAGEAWRYNDSGSDRGVNWRDPAYDDGTWASGPAPFGYGEGDERTLLSFGANPQAKNITTTFRKSFTIPAGTTLNNVVLRLCYNDGVAVYLNGIEVLRRDLPAKAAFDQLATAPRESFQNCWAGTNISASALHVGANTIAVELHRATANGSSLTFDLQLIASAFDRLADGTDPNEPRDTTPPTLSIISPAANAIFTNEAVTVRGLSMDKSGIDRVQCGTDLNALVTATGTKTWTAAVSLAVGTNLVYAMAFDTHANTTLTSRRFVRRALSPLSVEVNGSGRVTPNLSGANLIVGNSYTLQATPAPRNLFVGWSGSLSSTATRFTFVMQSNLALRANFVTNPFIASKGQYRGLFEDPNRLAHESSGDLSLTLTDQGKFTGVLRPGGKAVRFTGQFNLNGDATLQAVYQVTNRLTLALHLDLVNGTEHLSGQITSAQWLALVTASRMATSGTLAAGRHTLYFSGSANGPAGHGIASLQMRPGGLMTLVGTLADGTIITAGGSSTREGAWPLYLPLYRQSGSILGWLNFTNDTHASLAGRCNWIKPAIPEDKFYPEGFATVSHVRGSTYSVQAASNYLASTSTTCLAVTGLDPTGQTNCLTRIPRDTLAGSGVKAFKLNLSTGLGTGTITNHLTRSPMPARFALLLPDGTGFGSVLTTNLSGALETVR